MPGSSIVAVPVLVLTGTVGAGKSTVAAAINDVLAERHIPNAAVDLDALVWSGRLTARGTTPPGDPGR